MFQPVLLERSELQITVQALAQQVEQHREQGALLQLNIQTLTQQLQQQRDQYETHVTDARADRAEQRRNIQTLTQQLEQQHGQYETRLAESRADRADAIANDKQNTMVLHNHLLQTPRLAAPKLKGKCNQTPCIVRQILTSPGSASRAETWRTAKIVHNYQRRKLPTKPAIVQTMRTLAQPKIQRILTKRYGHETTMYADILDVMSDTLPDLASLHNTSNNPFLAGQKPDITLATAGAVKPEPDLVCAVFEVKKLDLKKLDTESEKDLGQVFDYLVAMFEAQPGRRVFTGILSSISRNTVLSLEVGEKGWTIVQHSNSDIYETLAYLFETALVDLAHQPPSPGFVYPHSKMRQRLGNPRHCVVGEFAVHNHPGLVMAVKRYANPASEISFLLAFSKLKSRPSSIPLLRYTADDGSEFGISPVGAPLIPGIFANPVQAHTILTDVLNALVWLHDLGIVHRDVRCENVVIAPGGHGVLIDFDAACDYRRGSTRLWRGGYICCPPRHVRRLYVGDVQWATTVYCPTPADDWHAWVLLVNTLVSVPFGGHADPGGEEAVGAVGGAAGVAGVGPVCGGGGEGGCSDAEIAAEGVYVVVSVCGDGGLGGRSSL